MIVSRVLLIVLAGVLILSAQAERFDYKVRELYFAGFAGNAASLEQAMKITAAQLAGEPDHAEALVWHGGGLFYQSGHAFRSGDMRRALELMQNGVQMMDRAVAMQPKNVAVRIPRGSAYLAASRDMPPAMGTPLLKKGIEDYEVCWEMQKGDLTQFSEHSLGELLTGIAEGNGRAGNTDKAKEFFLLIQEKLPASAYAKRASKWLAEGKLSARESNCIGCHVGSPKVR